MNMIEQRFAKILIKHLKQKAGEIHDIYIRVFLAGSVQTCKEI